MPGSLLLKKSMSRLSSALYGMRVIQFILCVTTVRVLIWIISASYSDPSRGCMAPMNSMARASGSPQCSASYPAMAAGYGRKALLDKGRPFILRLTNMPRRQAGRRKLLFDYLVTILRREPNHQG